MKAHEMYEIGDVLLDMDGIAILDVIGYYGHRHIISSILFGYTSDEVTAEYASKISGLKLYPPSRFAVSEVIKNGLFITPQKFIHVKYMNVYDLGNAIVASDPVSRRFVMETHPGKDYGIVTDGVLTAVKGESNGASFDKVVVDVYTYVIKHLIGDGYYKDDIIVGNCFGCETSEMFECLKCHLNPPVAGEIIIHALKEKTGSNDVQIVNGDAVVDGRDIYELRMYIHDGAVKYKPIYHNRWGL